MTTKHSISLMFCGLCLVTKAHTQPLTTSQANEIETLTVSYARNLKSLDDSRTSDNTVLFPELLSSKQRSIADMLTQAAGVSLNGQGGLFQSYNIRGFSRARIKTEVNGIPIISDRRAGNSLSFIPPAMISQALIQKGPQSSLYGSGAMGGVVSISTNEIDESLFSYSFQPQDNAQQFFSRINFNDIAASISHRQADNATSANNSNSSRQLNSQYQQTAASLSGEFTWKNIDILASTLYSRGEDIGKSAITYPEQRISNYPKDNHLLSQISFSSSDNWQLRLYQHQQHWQTNVVRLISNQIDRINLTDYQSDTYGLYAAYQVDNSIIGIEWLSRENIDINEKEFNQAHQQLWQKDLVNADENNIAIFALHDWHLHDLTLSAGARFDQIKLKQYQQNKRDNYSSFSLSANYRLSNKTNMNVQVANAFRFPSVSELFFAGQTPRGNTQGNPNLSAEKSIGVQFSLKHSVTSNLQVNINAYHYDVDDYIERYRVADTRFYRNQDDVTIRGIELQSDWKINQHWHSQLAFQWQQGSTQQNTTIEDGIPKALKWSLQWQGDKLSIRQHVNYQFSQKNVAATELPQNNELIWNTAVDYQVNKQLKLIFSLLNLTDNLYKASRDEDAAYQPGRQVRFSGTWRF